MRRILLKLSGEALAGGKPFGIDDETLGSLCQEVASVTSLGVQVGLVIGGGNFFRGARAMSVDRVQADYMGMLATVMNAIALRQALERQGMEARVQSALAIPEVAEPYVRERALRHLDRDRVVVFAAGTGNPLFTTDTAASLRAVEIGAEIMLKATKVDGVYDSDPLENPRASRLERLSYTEVLGARLGVMDATAVALCRDHSMPVRVFDIAQAGNLRRIVCGEPVGSLIWTEEAA